MARWDTLLTKISIKLIIDSDDTNTDKITCFDVINSAPVHWPLLTSFTECPVPGNEATRHNKKDTGRNTKSNVDTNIFAYLRTMY